MEQSAHAEREARTDPMGRICNDYRALNEKTIPIPSVVPIIGDVLDAISEGKIFSKVDMTQGFLQLRLAEESMHKTAFSCYMGVFA